METDTDDCNPPALSRTPSTVYDAVLYTLASNSRITGPDLAFEHAIIRITRAANNNKKMDKTIRTLVTTLLEVFP